MIFLQTFAIFCGLGVHNCQLYESVMKLNVAFEVLAFHAMASPEDVEKLAVRSPTALHTILNPHTHRLW